MKLSNKYGLYKVVNYILLHFYLSHCDTDTLGQWVLVSRKDCRILPLQQQISPACIQILTGWLLHPLRLRRLECNFGRDESVWDVRIRLRRHVSYSVTLTTRLSPRNRPLPSASRAKDRTTWCSRSILLSLSLATKIQRHQRVGELEMKPGRTSSRVNLSVSLFRRDKGCWASWKDDRSQNVR